MDFQTVWHSVASGEVSLVSGVAFVVAALLCLAVFLLLPADEKKLVRTPAVLLLLHAVVRLLEWVVPAAADETLLGAFAVFLLLASLGRSGFLLVLHSIVAQRLSGPVPRIIRDLIQAVIYGAVAVVALSVAGVEAGSLLTTSALLTAVIGLSLQDTLGNLFSGLAIQAQRPFDVGDWIQFDDDPEHVGCVTEMNWRAVTVVTLDHNEITVPNTTLAKASLRNFTRPTVVARRSMTVFAPMEVRTHRVHRLLIESIAEVPGVLPDPPPSVVTRSFHERGMEYQLRYFIDDFDRREIVSSEVHDRVFYALRRARIEVPPPGRAVAMHEISEESRRRERELEVGQVRRALDKVDFLRVLPREARESLAQHSDRRVYVAGEPVVMAGELGSELFVVEAGKARVEVKGESRKTRSLTVLGPGTFFGEMGLMTGAERRATVRALEETTVIVVDKSGLQPLLESSPELAESMSRVLAEREEQISELERLRTNPGTTQEERSLMILDRIKRFFSIEGNHE